MKWLWLAFVAAALVGCGERHATPVSVADAAPAAIVPELTTTTPPPPAFQERRDSPSVSYETYNTDGSSETCVNGRLIVAVVKMQGGEPTAYCGRKYPIFNAQGGLSDQFLGLLRRKEAEWNEQLVQRQKAWVQRFEPRAAEYRRQGYNSTYPKYDAPKFSVGMSFSTPREVEKKIRAAVKTAGFKVL